MSNENMEEKSPRGNGTVCNFVSLEIKNGAQSHIWHDFYGKQVWTENVKDVEWLTVELANDSEEISYIQIELDQLNEISHIGDNSRHDQFEKLEKTTTMQTVTIQIQNHTRTTQSHNHSETNTNV